jgi:hypothetical protein
MTKGLSTSGSVAENFLQYFEHLVIKYNIDNKSVVFYTQYFDDIVIIYDCTKTTHTHTQILYLMFIGPCFIVIVEE